ncbi:hypothetical protein [Streptomyces sp. NPDC051079]|uniref:hypothetical protein n=1 Tax=Streptomyces sp. NPDC051079 TaxID=3155043 RepID=UPI00344CC29D
MANLHYEILTDPGQLQVSGKGKDEESPGVVHIVVSNPSAWSVTLYELEVTVPFGSGKTHLTAHVDRIRARLGASTLSSSVGLSENWNGTTGTYRLEALSGVRLRKGEVIVIEIADFPVSSEEGLVLLSVAEDSHGRGPRSDHLVTLSLLKHAPRIPRNFRADSTLLGATEQVTLRWDGPEDLDYKIQGPVGSPQPVLQTSGDWHWSPKQGEEPKRDATYILIATPKSPHQPGYYLTTTVHLRNPEFESVTATAGLSTPWVKGIEHEGRIEFTDLGAKVLDKQRAAGTVEVKAAVAETVLATAGVNAPWVKGTDHEGRIRFTDRGAEILDSGQASGTVTAATADVDSVRTALVRGRDGGAGWIRLPADGITVGHGDGGDLGVVTAERIRVTGVNTTWVGDVDGGKGWLEFPRSGVNVRKDGGQEWGTVAADKADLNGINTSWVQGRTTADGWIEFPTGGLNVFQGAGDRQWGTVAAGTADLNDMVTHRARVKERLHLEGGLTVDDVLETQDGPPRLIVHGRLDAEGEVLAARTVTVAGDLTTKGILRVFGESRFRGKVNANGHLSVRNGESWILHTNDGKVAIQGDLRVHGAFRSDS